VEFLSATEQAELVRKGEVAPAELFRLYRERIERLDPELNAFVTVCEPTEPRDGPFRGVPLPIKDLTETEGVRTTYSSRAFADYVPDFDPAVVRRLKDAGFVLLGKTNSCELGITVVTESELNGICRNPWDVSRTPGGSSGGAAVAVAAGMAPLAHGSDGGGSIRIPASCCGLFGLKASRGRISPAPYSGLEGYSTSGPVARSVLDAAAMLDVLAGYEPGDPWWTPAPERPFVDEVGRDPGRLRVGLTTVPAVDAPVAPDCIAAAEDAAALLEELGHSVEEAPAPPWRDDSLFELFMTVWQVTPALYGKPIELFERNNRALIEAARETDSVEYVLATVQLRSLGRATVEYVSQYDLLLTPTLAQPPVPVGTVIGDDAWDSFRRAGEVTGFTQTANISGLPAASLPLWWNDGGLPIGVQLMGGPADEATLIRVSAQLEQARPWRDRRPPVS
jgi:amidase